MNIIFGKDQVESLFDKYTVLELDTIQLNKTVTTAYSVIEKIPLADLFQLGLHQEQHNLLMQNYRAGNWNKCYDNINNLIGKWGGELDSFYSEMKLRIENLETLPIDHSWTGIINKDS
jgi:hypothetical protein